MKNKKGNVAVIAVIIAIVAITAGVVGWMFAKKSQSPTQSEVEIQPAPVVQQTAPIKSTDDTANWKNFTGKFHKVSLKYPESVSVVETEGSLSLDDISQGSSMKINGSPVGESFIVIKKFGDGFSKESIMDTSYLTNVKKSNIILDGKSFQEIEGTFNNIEVCSKDFETGVKRIILDDLAILIFQDGSCERLSDGFKMADQILPTLKFTK